MFGQGFGGSVSALNGLEFLFEVRRVLGANSKRDDCAGISQHGVADGGLKLV
jgi:hypothetical protein